ncbi:DUF2306 domain-containing protein [Yoonia sp. R2331]|uniref:DUF2306 domain-containing protein n=1 Tax=Yoonia sp. R2331 TaxID=3237238 RepID=UPI0034E3D15D
MGRRSVNAISVPALLLFLTAIPTVMAGVRVVQIPAGTTPQDVAYLMTQPLPYWLHAAAGATFGLLGPLQFGRALAQRFGRLHKFLGRIFVAAGVVLGLSGLRLLLAFPGSSTLIIDVARMLGGIVLLVALALAIRAVMDRDIPRHRAWMIRAYAIGMGQSLIAFILFPIYLITGEPPVGVMSDLTVVASWALSIAAGEWVIRRINRPAPIQIHT